MFGGNSSIFFAVKCMIRMNPFSVIFFYFISCIMVLSYIIKIIEGPIYLINLNSQANLIDFRSFSNCMWYTFITMATVGYGDYYAQTILGRIVGVIDAVIGTVFISLFIIYLQKVLCLNEIEKASVIFLNRLSYKDMIKKEASLAFLTAFKYNQVKIKYLNEIKSERKNGNKIKKYRSHLESLYYKKMSFNKSLKKCIQ